MEISHMRRNRLDLNEFHEANLPRTSVVGTNLAGTVSKMAAKTAVAVVFVALGSSAFSWAQQTGQKTFSSAGEAAGALVAAAKNSDEKAMLEILGRDGKQVVSSGDDAEDAESRTNFVKQYEAMHRLVKEPDGTTVLYIGAKNWPTPIPLMNKGNMWYFDTEAGKQEILYRRVGRNEMSAIRVCQELAASEKEYSAAHGEYASKIYSDEGQHNGLYWKAAEGEPKSHIGPLVAAAITESYSKNRDTAATPFRGYYFRVLVRQGKDAPGGAKSYEADGKMKNGFAFVAYPAEYRSSGVMSFVVGEDGVVYEKDLGKKTEALAKGMKDYDPNSSWHKAEEQATQTASGSEPAK
jgi:hypothetical protein